MSGVTKNIFFQRRLTNSQQIYVRGLDNIKDQEMQIKMT